MARVKTISIPDNEIEKYDRAIEGIRERWGFEKDAKIVRESVYQIWEWIMDKKELIDSNGKQENINTSQHNYLEYKWELATNQFVSLNEAFKSGNLPLIRKVVRKAIRNLL